MKKLYLSFILFFSKKAILLVFALFLISNAQSQTYVTIPDPQFSYWLETHLYSAMNGNQMDITDSEVTGLTSMDISNKEIFNLEGIQYVTALKGLFCANN
jgi:hypothetical protein